MLLAKIVLACFYWIMCGVDVDLVDTIHTFCFNIGSWLSCHQRNFFYQ